MTPQEWLPLAVEVVKYIAWPVAVVVIARTLGPQLLELLRGRKVDIQAFGMKATVTAIEQQQVTVSEHPVTGHPLEPPAPAPAIDRPALQLIENRIRADLAAYSAAGREPALVTALARMRLTGQHEFTYNRIFGSQIAGLKRLDEIGGATVEEARAFFQPVPKQFPDYYKNYGFDGWLGFMLSSGLVERAGDRLTATAFGHDFLIYLREARLTEAKLG